MPVVDASVVVEIIAPDVPVEAIAKTLMKELVASEQEIVAPALLWLEASNALVTGIRRGRWDGADADAASARLNDLFIRRADTPQDYERAFELARRYDNWPVFDMVYVALAERLGTELLTTDKRLRTRLAHLPWVRGLETA